MEEAREWRMVCAKYDDDGHQLHKYEKSTRHKAEQSVIDANHRADMDEGYFYEGCAPYEVQSRPRQDWTYE